MSLDFSFTRTNRTFWGQWLWTIDLGSYFVACLLIGLGILCIMASSPSVAQHYEYPKFFYLKRHALFALIGLATLTLSSHLSIHHLRRGAFVVFGVMLILLWITLFWATPIKGARRWLSFGGVQLQPSEILRPCFLVVSAWLLSEDKRLAGSFPGQKWAWAVLMLTILPLVLQPDVGMTILLTASFLAQIFALGLAWRLIIAAGFLGAGAGTALFFFFPHVRRRVMMFLSPDQGDPFGDMFQISKSMSSFRTGGLWGVGPGEGHIKHSLPDAHTDFIFSVVGEEFGAILSIVLMGLFAFIILRHLIRALANQNLFIALAIIGLTISFGLQAFIHFASALGLIPTKGMPLPLISYGGSSMISSCLTLGALLAFTRRREFL
jgi:cell division protein FtsW